MTKKSHPGQSADFSDPFIHGTSSITLSLMAKTDFQLMPILRMMEDFYTAPMVGELTDGGYSTLGKKVSREEDVGAIAFGKLKTGEYNLDKIISSYTLFSPVDRNKSLKEFKKKLRSTLAEGFSEFNLLLIYLVRARQTHSSLQQVITKEECDLLKQQLEGLIQFYYFIQLLGSYIFPDLEALEEILSSSLSKDDISDAIGSILTLENIVERIIRNEINMKEIVENPTSENLQKALTVLELPSKSLIAPRFGGCRKEIHLPITQFFKLNKPVPRKSSGYRGYRKEDFWFFAKNNPSYGIHVFLRGYLEENYNSEYFIKLAKNARNHIQILEDRFRILNRLLEASQDKFAFTKGQKALFNTTFPVIFVSNSEKIKSFFTENRSNVPLKLGNDIQIIATDTHKHREQLKQFLFKHQVGPVQVVLISELQKVAQNKKSGLPMSIDTPQLRSMFAKTRESKHQAKFFKLYQLFEELNEKRNNLKESDSEAFEAINNILEGIDSAMDTAFLSGNPTNKTINTFCHKCIDIIHSKEKILKHHRGIKGPLDTMLTVLASLVVFYPFVYLYQINHNVQHSFFKTDSEKKADKAISTLIQLSNLTEGEVEEIIDCSI